MSKLPILRTSERNDFARCQQRWWWAWREGLRPKGDPAVALWFGSIIHECLAKWYCGPGVKRGPLPVETFTEIMKAEEVGWKIRVTERETNPSGALSEETLVDARELGEAMTNGYVQTYGRDEHMHVIQAERTFQMDIPHWTKARIAGIFAGTYDLVWRDLRDDSIALEEHKTAKAITTGHLPMDRQAGGYWTVASANLRHEKLIGKKEHISRIEYNFLRKALPDTRPRDEEGYAHNMPLKRHYLEALGYTGSSPEAKKYSLADLHNLCEKYGKVVLGDISKIQGKPLFERYEVHRRPKELGTQVARIQAELQQMDAIRRGKLPITKNTNRECEHLCQFYHMCLLHEAGSNWEDFRDAAFVVKDPYADHRKSTEG